jgi:hypothetical protein
MKLGKGILILIVVLFLSISNELVAQEKLPVLLGFQPGVTKEKFYEQNELDVNIFPLVVEVPTAKRIDLRLVTILNYHYGPKRQISDIGFQLIAPVFFNKRETTNTPIYGFYVGPVYGWGRNILNSHGTHTAGFEAGYQMAAGKSFTVTFGVQLGGSYFTYDEAENTWTDHFGIKINLAWWLRR